MQNEDSTPSGDPKSDIEKIKENLIIVCIIGVLVVLWYIIVPSFIRELLFTLAVILSPFAFFLLLYFAIKKRK